MNRTGSIGSRVPRPTRGIEGHPTGRSVRHRRSIARETRLRQRPTPCSPREASAPSSGSITVTPRSRSVARFAWVAGSRYIRSFIAATSRGAEQARKEVVTIESAIPAASSRDRVRRRRGDQVASAFATTPRWPIDRAPGQGRRGRPHRARTHPSEPGRRRCPRRTRVPRTASRPGSSEPGPSALLGGEAGQLSAL